MGKYHLIYADYGETGLRVSAQMKLLYQTEGSSPLTLVTQAHTILSLENNVETIVRSYEKRRPVVSRDLVFDIRTGSGRRIELLKYRYYEEE